MKPVSKSVRKALPLLKFIAKEPKLVLRNRFLKNLGGDLTVFDAMSEISRNYINKKIKLKPHHSKIVSSPKNLKKLETFNCKSVRNSCRKRKNALIQTGGLLPFLIPAAATIIDLLLSKYNK